MPASVDFDELIYHNAGSTIHINREGTLIRVSWFGDISKEDFQAAYKQLFSEIKQREVARILSDERNIMGMSTKGRMWLVTKFAKKEGKSALILLKRISIVKARSVFATTLTKLLYKTLCAIHPFEYEYFDEEEDALGWLQG